MTATSCSANCDRMNTQSWVLLTSVVVKFRFFFFLTSTSFGNRKTPSCWKKAPAFRGTKKFRNMCDAALRAQTLPDSNLIDMNSSVQYAMAAYYWAVHQGT